MRRSGTTGRDDSPISEEHAEPVTDDYPGLSRYAFSGGTIKEAVVDVSGEPFVDLEKEGKP